MHANSEPAEHACARMIEAQAPIDYEWLTRPFTGLFQEADAPEANSSVVRYRGDSIRFLNPQKEWVRVTYECTFDALTKKAVEVRLRPGRIGQPAHVAAATPAPATRPAGLAQVKAEPLAKAIEEAAKHPQGTKTARVIRPWEPSEIQIQQVR